MDASQFIPTVADEHGTTRPCSAQDIIYRAFSRPYAGSSSPVITVFASCSYPTGNWNIYFESVRGGGYRLMEQVPGLVYHIITYYTTSYTVGLGQPGPIDYVEIEDGFGVHKVPVEPLT